VTGLVVLEPPLNHSGPWRPAGHARPEPLLTAPRYMRTKGMSRWHRPRSGIRHVQQGYESWTFWCGQRANSRRNPLGAAELPPGDPVCGTCEGRAVGAGQDEWPGGKVLLFEPHRLITPKTCPGSRDERMFEWVSHRGSVGRCLACGEHVAVRSMGGPFNGKVALTTHEPGGALVGGCPFHAWRELTVIDGHAACACLLENAR